MPETLDWFEDENGRHRVFISDEIRCSWTHWWWGACIRNPHHRGRTHMVIGHAQTQYQDDTGHVARHLELGELIEVPKYTRRTPLDS